MFEAELDAETFYTYLNTKHKNIKFTYEKQIENKLPFLNILISNKESLQTSVFHKKTNTELTLTGSMSGETPNIETRYFKLPYIGMYSKVTQKKIEKICKRFCKNAKVKLVLTSDKLRQTLTYKNSYPSVLISKVVYKFVCASCNASFTGQTH